MTLGMTGSRKWSDESRMAKELVPLLKNASKLITGGAAGADCMALKIAAREGVMVKEIRPDYNKYGRSAPHVRNTEIISQSDAIIAFWDGESKGTKSTIAKARKANKLLAIINTGEIE